MGSEGRSERTRIVGGGRAVLAAASLVCLALYLAQPHAGFVFDDSVTILHNRMVQESPSSAVRENPFRSVVNLTFWLQHRLHRPGFAPMPIDQALPRIEQNQDERLRPLYRDPATGQTVPVTLDRERGMVYPLPPAWPFHLFNLLVHVVNAWLLFYLVRRLGASDLLAVATAAAFLLHPLATEPVNYITARFALLSLTFSLAAVLAHLRADGRVRGELVAAGFYLLALLCKETAAPLPLLVLILDALRGRSRPVVLLSLLLTGVYAFARSRWLVVLEARPGETLDWPLYLLTEQRVFWLYLGKVLWPIHLNFDHHVVSRSTLDGILAFINLLLLGTGTVILLRRLTALRNNQSSLEESSRPGGRSCILAVFLLSWLALSPTGTLIPLADLAREDRAYPLLAIIIPASAFTVRRLLDPLGPLRRRTVVVAALTVISLLAAGTAARNDDWSTELTLHHDIVAKSPHKARAVYNYATALKWRGRLPEALHWYERALELDPTHRNAAINAAALRKILGQR